eukprot:PhM_4_TR17504/c0_g2_i1/m.976
MLAEVLTLHGKTDLAAGAASVHDTVDTGLLGDADGSRFVVSRDHAHKNTSGLAAGNGSLDLRAKGILNTQKSDKGESNLGLLCGEGIGAGTGVLGSGEDVGVRNTDRAKTVLGKLVDGVDDGALGVGIEVALKTIDHYLLAILQNHLAGTLNMYAHLVTFAEAGRHALLGAGERERVCGTIVAGADFEGLEVHLLKEDKHCLLCLIALILELALGTLRHLLVSCGVNGKALEHELDLGGVLSLDVAEDVGVAMGIAGQFICALANVRLHHRHFVLGECARLVGANGSGTAHRLASSQVTDEVVLLHHLLHAVGKRDRHGQWKPLGHGDDDDSDGGCQHLQVALDFELGIAIHCQVDLLRSEACEREYGSKQSEVTNVVSELT